MRGPDAPAAGERFSKRHGYLFEVPVRRGPGELEPGEPLRAAGRFAHEAAAVDQRTGIVYETEDPGSGRGAGFYRFIPHDPEELTEGGRLQMLAVRDHPQLDMREGQQVGRRLEVTWVDIDDPDPEQTERQRPARDLLPGPRQGRRAVQPARGLLGGRRQHLLRVHQRRRRQERRRQLGRLRGGLRPGLGVPPGRQGRLAAARLRVAERRRSSTRPTTSRSRRAAA